VIARPLDEVGGDEEVGGEAELVDDVSTSYFRRSWIEGSAAFSAVAFERPSWQTRIRYSSRGEPSGDANCGYFSDEVESSLSSTLQRSAISSVASQAPGMSAKSSRISSGVLK
jgi:hypothetical protein